MRLWGKRNEDADDPPAASLPPESGAPVDPVAIAAGETFKLTLIITTAITGFTLVADVALSILVKHPTSQASQAIGTCDTIAKIGVGAIAGLLRGKSAS